MKKYCLVSDESGHDYVIPSERRNDWYSLTDDVVPEWAVMLSGTLEFENPSECGRLLFPVEGRRIFKIDFSTCKDWDECMKWIDNQPDYESDFDNWLKYWKKSGLIKDERFIEK